MYSSRRITLLSPSPQLNLSSFLRFRFRKEEQIVIDYIRVDRVLYLLQFVRPFVRFVRKVLFEDLISHHLRKYGFPFLWFKTYYYTV